MFPVAGKPGQFTSEELVRATVVVPAAHVDAARTFCHEFMVERDYPHGKETLLPTPLSEDGTGTPTHYACRKTWTRTELDAFHELLATQRAMGKSFVTNRRLERGEPKTRLRSVMANIEGGDREVETALGLKRING